MKNLRRMLCLFLAALMLTSQALAIDIISPGSGGSTPGSGGGGTGSPWSSPTSGDKGAGLLLHVEQMPSSVQVRGNEVKNWGDILGYWTTHFPNTDPDVKQTGIYLLPSWNDGNAAAAIQHKRSSSGLEYSYQLVSSIRMTTPSSEKKNWFGYTAYTKAAANQSANLKNPNFSLPENYWRTAIAGAATEECVSVVSQLFSAGSTVNGFTTDTDVENVNKRVNHYLGLDEGINDWDGLLDDQRDVAGFMNYCGFLATVIRCLPDSEQATLAKQLDAMCQNFLRGKSYQPMVVTGELVVATEYNNDTQYSCWWTPQQALSAVTGSKINDQIENNGSDDPITQLGKKYYTSRKGNKGGLTMYGYPNSSGWSPYKGDGFTLPVFGTVMSSVSEALLGEYGINQKPINGFGVWGLSTPFVPQATIPSMEVAVNGITGLAVEDTSYVKGVGAYTETVTVTIPVNLDTSGFVYSETIGDTSRVIEDSGPGFASSVRWLANKRNEGAIFANPITNIWLGYSKDLDALSDTAASKLIEDSNGYHQDGVNPSSTDKLASWSPPQGEAGIDFGWEAVILNGTSTIKIPDIPGVKTSVTSTGTGIMLEFQDLEGAAEYFQTHGSTFNITVEIPVNGTLDTEDSVKQHWFKSGANMVLFGPASLDNMSTVVEVGALLYSYPKYAYTTVVAKPEEKPFYYSKVQPAFSELKQGTVPSTGGGSSEKFNSMTGTPTFTDTGIRVDFEGTQYENTGRYYQYFASGGSEFVVQFDGEYVESANSSRKYTATFSNVNCDLYRTEAHIACPGHPGKDGTTYCAHHGCPTHATCTSNHSVGDTFTWEQAVNGFSYVKITNLKVWKLSEAKLDGTRELLDTDEVTATVQSVAPSLSYNIAGSDTASEGRLIYSYNTNQKDSAVITGYPKTSDNSCSSHRANNQKTLDGDTSGVTCSAICISDFIVLRTSNGDQSILYYEYKSKNEAAINKGNCVAEAIEFDKVPYETIWKGNGKTSEGCGLPDDGITYGGYNGNYSSMSTKYKSTGHASNIDFNSTEAYKNKSAMSGSWDAITEKPTQKFRLLNDKLVIPDYKQNGEYSVGESNIFYENIINYGSKTPNYPIVPQPDFGGRRGFVLHTTYSSGHDKINDVVVYNPVSNQNAIIVSLPEERDQRIATHAMPGVDKSAGCPGDASCPYLKNECTVTEHVHTEACYELLEYEVHGPNNAHEHTAACSYHNIGTYGTWVSVSHYSSHSVTGYKTTLNGYEVVVGTDGYTYMFGSECSRSSTVTQYGTSFPLAGQYSYDTHYNGSSGHRDIQWKFVSSLNGGGADGAGKVYDCGNLPLNKHVCGGSGSSGGSITTGQSKDFNYTGGVQSITLDPGTYKLETWGAQGGSSSSAGGFGGYSTGQMTLTSTTTLYVVVGGQGSSTSGGYNGGGVAGDTASSGGGATHVAIANGQLYDLSSNQSSVLIVAGGGGGGGYSPGYAGGAGGGNAGLEGQGHSQCGSGGSQVAGGSVIGWSGGVSGVFGKGGYIVSSDSFGSKAGGGGGWYGGGAGVAGGGGSGYLSPSLTAASTTAGSRSGNGYARITAVAVTPTVTCYTMNKALLSCADPHHVYSYNWKTYTYGLQHTSGRICTGRSCTDTTNLVFPTQEKYTVAQCAAGSIVRHANGNVHLTTTSGTCSYCGSTYKEVLSAAQAVDRVPAASEYSCYTYGDPRCWSPCGNNANHQKYVTEVVDNGTTYKMGDFINIDWPFTIYFPNTGDFYGTGAKWASDTSAERGYGYTNGMDATEWTKTKWVEFPFAVVYNNQTFLAYERIYLEVPKTVFEFYVPLHDSEVASAEIKFGSVAINTQNGETLECGANRDHNIQAITYAGKPMAHHHNADKRTYIDVVGRIGNLALNDTGDFRFSNFFKQATSGWIVDNIVHKVDFTKQNNILLDKIDVRGVAISSTGVAGNTHGTRPERGSIGKISAFPLSPAMNNITALQKQPIRVGYDSYFDLTTLGNYYGNTVYDDGGDIVGQNLVLVKPHYYRLDLDNGNYQPVDVYMDVNGNKVLINDNDSNTVAYNGTDTQVNLNWVEEQARRNYTGSEVTNSKAVADANTWVELPSSSTWVYGNYNLLNLTQRNRTFVGSEYTYADKDNWVAHKDPSDRLPGTLAALQGARWHFNVGLPSSSVFVYSGQEASQANIDACASGNAVIFCALEIYAQGEVWTLAYDGSNVNRPFTVTPGGKVYDPVIPYPAGKNPKGEEMPIVEIISINHSSKEDLNTSGTQ